jgi:hypothetical protein
MPARKKKPRKLIQYTLRAVPPEVDRWLRRRAREESRSLNEFAIKVLSDAARSTIGRSAPVKRNLSWLVGALGADDELDRLMRDQRRVDEKAWR